MEKRFSIIIWAYNIEKYIKKAINSVLKQTFENYEIILFNDGSVDGTLNKMKEFEENPKIKILSSDINRGLGAGRNICMKEAEGEYIIYLDGDDTLYEKTTLYRRKTQRSAGVRKGIKIKDKKSGRIFRIRRSSDHMVRRTSGYDELSGRVWPGIEKMESSDTSVYSFGV